MDEMQSGAVFVFHLFDRLNFPTKTSQFGKFLLNFLQSFMSLTVGDLRLLITGAALSVCLIQLLDMSDFGPETCDLFQKDV